jgi:hypothetical protein
VPLPCCPYQAATTTLLARSNFVWKENSTADKIMLNIYMLCKLLPAQITLLFSNYVVNNFNKGLEIDLYNATC